jgi:tRNA(Ile)-lysidine synthase
MVPVKFEKTQTVWSAFHAGPYGVPAGTVITIAVSGGPDSTALARAAAASGSHSLQLLHVQHGLRGAESIADQQFVAALAEDLGLPVTVVDAPIEGSQAIETRARDARLSVFNRIGGVIATAHTRDDQVETIQMRLERGTGLRGLCGIPERRPLGETGWLIRPLLALSREDLETDLREAGQDWCEDTMNADPAWHRNRIRHLTLPALQKVTPGWAADLLRMRSLAVEIEATTRAWVDQHLDPVDGSFAVTAPDTMVPYLLAESFRRQEGATPDLSEGQLLDCVSSIRDGRGVTDRLPGGRWVQVTDGRVTVGRGRQTAEMPVVRWELVEDLPAELSAGAPNCAWIDPASVQGAIRVRRRVPGDRFHPFGSAGGRKLKDFLIDARIPRHQRDAIPIVVDDVGILWVGGLRPDERTRLTPEATGGIRMWIDSEISDVMSPA